MIKRIFIFLFIISFYQNALSQVGAKSLVFNGTSDYYSVPDNSSLDLSGNLTIEAWINPCDTVGLHSVVTKLWCSGGEYAFYLNIKDGKLQWLWDGDGFCSPTIYNLYETSLPIIRNNIWQHIAIVHTSTSVTLYYNGVVATSTLASGSYSGLINNSNQPLRVGAYRWNSGSFGGFFNGRMDEIRIWNTALTSSQILARKNLSLVGNETNLVLYHDFDIDTNRTIQNKATSSGTTNNGLTTSLSPYFLSNPSTYPVPVNLGNDTILCSQTNITLDAGASSFSYLWDNSSTSRLRTVNSTGIYSVSVSKDKCIVSDTITVTMDSLKLNLGNDTTVCNINSLLLDATTLGCTYLWNDGSSNATYSAITSGNHWATISKGMCSLTDTINITFDSVSVTLPNDTTICPGDSIVLQATTTATSFLWNTGSTSSSIVVKNAGIYWVEVTQNGCVARDSFELLINNNSVILGNDTVICGVTTLLLDANNVGATYLWNNGSTNSSIMVNSTGLYSVIITNKGCSTTDSIYVRFQELNSSFIVSDTAGCEPLSVNFSDLSSVNYGSITNWNWTFGDGTFSSLQNPLKIYSVPGIYSVNLNITSNFGCFDDTVINSLIQVYPKPSPSFSFQSIGLFTDDIIDFTNLSSNANTYFWSFGDGGTSILENPQYSYSIPGIYSVQLVTYNQFGCLDSLSLDIIINEDSKIFAPNTFTPDNNDLNEEWKIYGLTDASTINLLIYNRWGELIFKTNSKTDSWDGKFDGEDAPTGIYTYKLKVNTFGEVNEYFGHINLIR